MSPSSVSHSLEDLGQVIELVCSGSAPHGQCGHVGGGAGTAAWGGTGDRWAEDAPLVSGWPRRLTEGSVQCQRWSRELCAAWFRGQATLCLFTWSQAPPPGIVPLDLSTWHRKAALGSGPARGPLLLSRRELVEAAPGGKAGGKEAYFRWAVGPFPSNWETGG